MRDGDDIINARITGKNLGPDTLDRILYRGRNTLHGSRDAEDVSGSTDPSWLT